MLQRFYEITQIQVLQKNSIENDTKEIYQLAERTKPAQIQLYIQMLVQAKKDINLYPSHTTAFNLLVMRMISFTLDKTSLTSLIKNAQVEPSVTITPNIPAHPSSEHNNSEMTAHDILKKQSSPATVAQSSTAQNHRQKSASDILKNHNQCTQKKTAPAEKKQATQAQQISKTKASTETTQGDSNDDWQKIMTNSHCTGLVKQILQKSTLSSNASSHTWEINIDESLENLATDNFKNKISELCKKALNREISITFNTKASAPAPHKTKAQTAPTRPQKTKETLVEKKPSRETLLKNNDKLQQFAKDLQAKPITKTSQQTVD